MRKRLEAEACRDGQAMKEVEMCYTCTHCNQCGLYSTRTDLRCAECGTAMPIGVSACPNCGGRKIKAVRMPNAPARDHSSAIKPTIVNE